MTENKTAEFLGPPSLWHAVTLELTGRKRSIRIKGTGQVEVLRGDDTQSGVIPVGEVHRFMSLIVRQDVAGAESPRDDGDIRLSGSNADRETFSLTKASNESFAPIDAVEAELESIVAELFPKKKGFLAKLFGR